MLQLAKCCLIKISSLQINASACQRLPRKCFFPPDECFSLREVTTAASTITVAPSIWQASFTLSCDDGRQWDVLQFKDWELEKQLREGTFTLVGTRTQNLQIRSLARYPLRHKSTLYSLVAKKKNMVIESTISTVLHLQNTTDQMPWINRPLKFQISCIREKKPRCANNKKRCADTVFLFFYFLPN